MGIYIPESLRELVRKRAEFRCEYCLIGDEDVMLPHEPDHVIATKHGGQNDESNLAWACFSCNRRKGTDIASLDPETGDISRLFNPRRDQRSQHLQLKSDGRFELLDIVGRTTAYFLDLNEAERVMIRQRLYRARRFPK